MSTYVAISWIVIKLLYSYFFKGVFIKLSASVVLIGLLLGGCGSSSSTGNSNTGTGYYIDSAVSGVSYVCGGESGITGEDGSFVFEKGKGCTFKLGDITLRNVNADNLKDKVKIVEDRVEVAQMLQSLDIDGNPDNGITISAKVVEKLKERQITKLPETTQELQAILDAAKEVDDFKGKLVSAEEAKAHLKKSQTQVTKELLAGKTLYAAYTEEDGTAVVERLIFNSDVTSVHWQQIMGGSKSGNDTLTIEGDTLISHDKDGATPHKIVEVTDKYIKLKKPKDDGSLKIEKLYFKEADARASFGGGSDNSQNASTDLKALLAGKTLYAAEKNHNDEIKWVKFNAQVTTVTMGDRTGDTVIQGDTFTIPDKDGEVGHYKVLENRGTYLVVKNIEGGKTFKLYFNKSDAQKALDSATGSDEQAPDPSSSIDLKALVAGKTVYKPDNHDGTKSITSFTFNQDMTQMKAIGSGTFTFDITTSGDRFTFDHEGKKRIYKLTGHNSEYLSMDYLEDETERVKDKYRFYFDRSKAESYLDTL